VGDTTLKGYRREDFVDGWKRYVLPSLIRNETSETSETSQQNQRLNVSDAPKLSETSETFDFVGAENVSDVSCVSHGGDLDPDGYTFNLEDYPDLPPALDRRQ
jgi:hypothetical protein